MSKDCGFIFHSVLWQHSSEEIYSNKYKLISYSLRSPRIFQFSCQGNDRIFLLSKHSIKCCLFQSSSLFPRFRILSIHPSAKSYTTICTAIKNNSVCLHVYHHSVALKYQVSPLVHSLDNFYPYPFKISSSICSL